MPPPVDLSQLAVRRAPPSASPSRVDGRMVLTRYVLPAALLAGLATLALWAAAGVIFPPRPVTVVPVVTSQATVRVEGTPLFKAAGWVEPRPTPVRVAALAAGVVERLLVVEDQAVAAGEPIAELVKDDAQLALDAALADLSLRQAELEEALAQRIAAQSRLESPTHLEAVLHEAQAALAQMATQQAHLPYEMRAAEARLRAAQLDYDGKLAASGVVSGLALQRAQAELEAAQAALEQLQRKGQSLAQEEAALRARLEALQRQRELQVDEIKALGEAEARVKSMEARVQQAQVAVAEARLRRERMTVRAPIDGRVYRLVAHPGARLSGEGGGAAASDGSTVVTLYQPERLQVRVDVRYEDLPRVTPGQAVQIESPAVGAALSGKVLYLGSMADIQKNTLEVKASIDAPPPLLKPEMLVDVTFLAPPQAEQAAGAAEELRVLISRRLVRQDDGGAYVWLADRRRGVARRAAVELGGRARDGLVEVLRGLAPGDRLIASDPEGLRDGLRIRVAGEAPPEDDPAPEQSGPLSPESSPLTDD